MIKRQHFLKNYETDNNQKVLTAVKNNIIVATLIVSAETEEKLDKMYGAAGYEISTYYFMGQKNIRK